MKSCSLQNDNCAKSYSLNDEDKLKQYLASPFVKIWQIITRVFEKTTIIIFCLSVVNHNVTSFCKMLSVDHLQKGSCLGECLP